MMMKSSHFFTSFLTFLLLLLLVDKSLSKSAGARSSLRRATFRSHPTGVGTSQWGQTVQRVEQQPPTKQIKGLSRIKQYFSNFGYLLSPAAARFNDDLDQVTVSAIKTYQRHFNLKVTGDLTNETLHLVSLPRCGIPDMNFDYDSVTKNNVSWPIAGNRWFPDRRNLTYGFSPASKIPSNATRVFKSAFARWAGFVAGLNLTEASSYDSADIKVGFYDLDEGVEDVVWGESVIGLQTGEIRLDAGKYWKLPSEKNGTGNGTVLDLESAAMHHIGHLLGLDHSRDENSVMYPYVLPTKPRKVELSSSDKESIRIVYSKGESVNCGVVRVITSLALGFGYYMLLIMA